MSASPGPLAGRIIVVTRPQGQAQALGEEITRLGGQPFYAPLLDILPIADSSELQTAASALACYSLAIFISPNAVSHALPTLMAAGDWPNGVAIAGIGPGTVQALADSGVSPVITPEHRFDSEAMLELPALQAEQVAGKRIALFRGDGGRELLADSLRARGAQVDCISCYRRLPPARGFGPLTELLLSGRCAALTLSSSEGLRHLLAGLGVEALSALQVIPVFVPHQRIADNARSSGLQQVVLTKPADAGILAGLCAYNWPQS